MIDFPFLETFKLNTDYINHLNVYWQLI